MLNALSHRATAVIIRPIVRRQSTVVSSSPFSGSAMASSTEARGTTTAFAEGETKSLQQRLDAASQSKQTNGRRGGGRGGNSRGRGRGGYRGRGSTNNNHRQRQSKPAEVVTSNFSAMHDKLRAARYKVHKPGCNCQKVKQIRASSLPLLSHHSSPTEGGATGNSRHQSEKQLDGLVVVPDIKIITNVYLCLDTGREAFQLDPFAAERKLREEMFPSTTTSISQDESQFKVSCAVCLLEQEPNGFVCVSSSVRQEVDVVRDMARQGAEEKLKKGALHADHAHYICTLPRRVLYKVACQRTTRRTADAKQEATKELREELARQGVPIGEASTTDSNQTIEFGHHLMSLLQITSHDHTASHWLTLVYDDSQTKASFEIDLPGGKRHLGEQSFEGAMRETEEEISLKIDQSWQVEREELKSNNLYYMLRPPADDIDKIVASANRLSLDG